MIRTWLRQWRGIEVAPEAHTRETIGGVDAITTPFRGFTVLAIAYPNHIQPEAKPLTAYDIALRLSHDMDVDWFLNDQDLTQYACTGPVPGNDEGEIAYGFDFGLYDRIARDFKVRYTVVVRETAGGGYMLLIQDSALAFAGKTRVLFDAVSAGRDRENPELDDDTGAASPR
jgi:hypothetical protein